MKYYFLLLFFFAAFNLTSKAQDKFTAWPALGEFHEVISATFHPAEKGDFEPVKQRSGELLNTAEKLGKSIVPEPYNTTEVKDAVKELQDKSGELNQLVINRAKDQKINKKLIEVHDSFHKIVGLCKD